MIVFSGDIGGTTTRMQLTEFIPGIHQGKVIKNSNYHNINYSTFTDIIGVFLTEADLDYTKIESACFGVAGPVVDGVVKFTNLPWMVETAEIKTKLKLQQVALINDFMAIGYGLETLSPENLFTIQPGKPCENGIKAYLGAGTGLGVGFIVYDQKSYTAYPTEGGHINFSPTDDEQIELLIFLLKKYHRVSFERLLSGPGLLNIYNFVSNNREDKKSELNILIAMAKEKHIDVAATIAEYAIKHHDNLAAQALNIFIRIYGSAAGNLALTTLPFGGLYIVGGIAPKLLPQIKSGEFYKAFSDKGRMSNLIKDIPLHVVLHTDVGLQGAAVYARKLAQ